MIDPDLKRQFDEYMRDPISLPDEWKAWLVKYIEASGMTLPIGQSIGYANAFTASTPSGVMFMYGGSSAPTNFLLCDGTAVSRTTYANLFTAIGTNYGVGNGTTTFNLPDFIGRVPVGLSVSGPALINALGNNDGVTTNNRSPDHNHILHLSGAFSVGGVSMPKEAFGGSNDTITSLNGSDPNNTGHPAFLVVNVIIKT